MNAVQQSSRAHQRRIHPFVVITALWVYAAAPAAQTTAPVGTYQRPFSAQSPWNSKPVNPVLGDASIPADEFSPSIHNGDYSLGVFQASSGGTTVVVRGTDDARGIWNADAEAFQPSVSIARWPTGVVPAAGADGHADIIDATSGIVHSFWQLRSVNGQWRATQYSWSPLRGRGWGSPTHYSQGARASGVPAGAGLIRKHEVNDGDTQYRHALAMSLTYSGLAANPSLTFPATLSDGDSARTNFGSIPMGSLLMLPASFDSASITHPQLRKIVETLKTYGAYVVDRNHGTPFVIYAETGSDLTFHRNGWDSQLAADLDRIRAELRPVKQAEGWVDANGQMFTPQQDGFNLLSMRGAWVTLYGTNTSKYNTWTQKLHFPYNAPVAQIAAFGKNILAQTPWAKPIGGRTYTFQANTSGGATARLVLTHCNDTARSVDTGYLQGTGSHTFVWPEALCSMKFEVLLAKKPTSSTGATVGSHIRLTGATPQ